MLFYMIKFTILLTTSEVSQPLLPKNTYSILRLQELSAHLATHPNPHRSNEDLYNEQSYHILQANKWL